MTRLITSCSPHMHDEADDVSHAQDETDELTSRTHSAKLRRTHARSKQRQMPARRSGWRQTSACSTKQVTSRSRQSRWSHTTLSSMQMTSYANKRMTSIYQILRATSQCCCSHSRAYVDIWRVVLEVPRPGSCECSTSDTRRRTHPDGLKQRQHAGLQ